MRTQPNKTALIQSATHYPSAATNAVVTLAAAAQTIHAIRSIHCSYSAAPTGGRLTVVAGSTTLLDVDITAAGPTVFLFDADCPLYKTVIGTTYENTGEAVVVTLYSGAGAVVGKLNVRYQ